jgi:predicted ATPase
LPDTRERAQQELMLQVTLGAPLQATRVFSSPEVHATYTRARELCQQLGETRQFFPVLFGLRMFHQVRGECLAARELGEQLLSLAQQEHDPALLAEAYWALGSTFFNLGEFGAARAHLEQSLTLYDAQRHPSQVSLRGGIEPRVFGLSEAALVLWHLGYPDQALETSGAARTLAQELSYPFGLAAARVFAAMLHQRRRDRLLTQEWAEAALTLGREQGFAAWLGPGIILRGWALSEQGQREEGISQICQGLATRQAIEAGIFRSYFLALLAEAYGKAGLAEEGLSALAEALVTVDKTEERFYEAELYRLKGELTLNKASVPGLKFSIQQEAKACFHKAIDIARTQQAKTLELRAAMSLARLWQQQDKRAEAHKLLSEIYGWFTEGFDTKDLQEAKVMLDGVSRTLSES